MAEPRPLLNIRAPTRVHNDRLDGDFPHFIFAYLYGDNLDWSRDT